MFLWNILGRRVEQRNRQVLTSELRQLARQYHIPRGRNSVIARQLQRRFAALRIWIAWASRRKLATKRADSSSELDPITLERPESPVFQYRHANGKVTRYTARVLIDFMLASKTFNEPTSNLAFSDNDLERLDGIAAQHKWAHDSLVQLRHSNVPMLARLHRQVDNVIELELQACASQLVEVISHPWQLRLQLQQFTLLYGELLQRSQASAQLALRSCLERLRSSLDWSEPAATFAYTIIENLDTS